MIQYSFTLSLQYNLFYTISSNLDILFIDRVQQGFNTINIHNRQYTVYLLIQSYHLESSLTNSVYLLKTPVNTIHLLLA
jgi:hypothetical protein